MPNKSYIYIYVVDLNNRYRDSAVARNTSRITLISPV